MSFRWEVAMAQLAEHIYYSVLKRQKNKEKRGLEKPIFEIDVIVLRS